MIIAEIARTMVYTALQEDVGAGDITGALIPEDTHVDAAIIAREPLLLCGQTWVNEVFAAVDSSIQITWLAKEGEYLSIPQTLCHLSGPARSILTAERTALNFLQVLSGTATTTYTYVKHLEGYTTRLLDTRKTLPGWRQAQKYAVRCGGGINHRMGLYDAFLIKENHIKACGSIERAIEAARRLQAYTFIEVEVETLNELQEALLMHPDRILLDNFTPSMIAEAIAMNLPKICPLEASGGFDLRTIEDVARTGVDYISIGALTKSVKAIDLSLLILKT